jgi:hypothetical protein
MSKSKLAALALASTFALISALPATAAARPAKPSPQVTTSGDAKGKLEVRQESRKVPGFFTDEAQQSCSFTCGGATVTCSGASASCTSSSCSASGGGVTLTATCS